jgi:hypothetical protein
MFWNKWKKETKIDKQIEQMREIEKTMKKRKREFAGTKLAKQARREEMYAQEVRLALVREKRRINN